MLCLQYCLFSSYRLAAAQNTGKAQYWLTGIASLVSWLSVVISFLTIWLGVSSGHRCVYDSANLCPICVLAPFVASITQSLTTSHAGPVARQHIVLEHTYSCCWSFPVESLRLLAGGF